MDYRSCTSELLQNLGIKKLYKGCEYIISSIDYMHKNEKYYAPITKVLYVEIAKDYNTSSLCVEKNVRSIIKSIWDKEENIPLLAEIFGEDNLSKRPSNLKFLTLLYQYIWEKMDSSPQINDYHFICPLSGNDCEFCKEFILETLEHLKKRPLS